MDEIPCTDDASNDEEVLPMSELEQRIFDEDLGVFFDILNEKIVAGVISPGRAESFFPPEVRERNK